MSAPNPYKRERYETTILQEVSLYLRRNLSDPRLKNVSLTHVELNGDYSEAIIYWDTFNLDLKSDCEKAIRKVTGPFRHHLSKTLKVRIVPIIKFRYNAQYLSEKKITDILEAEISKEMDSIED